MRSRSYQTLNLNLLNMRPILVALSFWVVATLPQVIYGQMGQNLFSGNAKAMSLGNAVTADPPGIDAIHFNPAGLTRLKGRQYELKMIAAGAQVKAKFTPSDSYTNELNRLGFSDPISNQTSESNRLNIYFNGRHIDLPFAVAPMGGVSYTPKNSKFTFANASYATLIGGIKRNRDDPGRFAYHQVGTTRLTYFSPTAAMQVTPTVSIGLSLGFSYFGIGAKTDLRFPNDVLGNAESLRQGFCSALGIDPEQFCPGSLDPTEPLATIDLKIQDTFSPTWNFGVLWEPRDWFTWGMVYQSSATDRLDGTLKITYSDGVRQLFDGVANTFGQAQLDAAGISNYTEQEVDALVKLEYPQHFSTGVSLQFLPDWKFNFDLKWTDSGVWQEWVITFDEPVDVLKVLGFALPATGEFNVESNRIVIPRGYNSVWNMSFGLEHQYSQRLALRAGYEPRPSHIPPDRLGLIIPIADIDLYSLGFSYEGKKDRVIEGAMAYIHSSYTIPPNSSTNFNDESSSNFVYNPYAGHQGDIELNVYVFLLSYRAPF